MTKENILAKLKDKFSNLGLSDEIMGAQSDFLLAQNPTDENIDTMISGIEPILKAYQSNLDKARAAKAKAEPKKAEATAEPEKAGGNADPMLEALQKLNERLDRMEKTTTVKTKSESLAKRLTDSGVPEKFYSRFLGATKFDAEDYDEEVYANELKADYDEFKQSFANEAASGGTPPAQSAGEAGSQVKRDIERLA